jgi:hypothetical protein
MTYQQTIAYVERQKGEDAARRFVVKMRARAAELQQQKGGLYRGHRDCVRSTFCNIDEGIAEHGRMCLACMLLLNHTQLFRRASNRDANSSAPFHPTANHRYSTSSQKSRKLDGQYTWRGIDARREKRKDISNQAMAAATPERVNAAQAAALQNLTEMGVFATQSSRLQVELQSKVDAANASLMECALKAAVAEDGVYNQASQQQASAAAELAKSAICHKQQQAASLERQQASTAAALAKQAAHHECDLAKQALNHKRDLACVSKQLGHNATAMRRQHEDDLK